jgi:GT2 family glycosyltransferase
MNSISICIVNYNTRELLLQCLKSIYASTEHVNLAIFVVDNNSVDGSSVAIEKTYPNVKLIKNTVNAGFGRANNQAMSLSRGKYVLLLNSDTIVKPEALEKLVAFMEDNPRVGMAGPRMLNEDGSVQASISNFPNLWFVIIRMFRLRALFPTRLLKNFAMKTKLFGSMVNSYLRVESQEPLRVENISGACMLIRREVIEQVGMFDEEYFMYVEDIDLCKRIIDAGWQISYLPSSEIIHLVGKSSGGTFRDLSPISYESLFYYFRKHRGKVYEASVRVVVVIALAMRGLLNITLHPINTSKGKNQTVKQYYAIMIRSLNMKAQ